MASNQCWGAWNWMFPAGNLASTFARSGYYMHAYGSVYGISGRVVAEVIAQNHENLRLLANEGDPSIVSVHFWMHFDILIARDWWEIIAHCHRDIDKKRKDYTNKIWPLI
eukprot:1140846-Pelagomonas_calceolata.AAC.1